MKKETLPKMFLKSVREFFLMKPNDKRYESDRQMLRRVSRKFGGLFFVISMFDILLIWFIILLDGVTHLIHLIIEAIEYSFIVFFEHIFDFNHYQSEIIIVNSTIIITLYMSYRLISAAPLLSIRLKRNFIAAWLRYMRREHSYWKAMSLGHKIKFVSAYAFGTTSLFYFITL